MRYARLSPDLNERYNEDDGHDAYGTFVVGDDHVVRWFTVDELHAMRGVGTPNASVGYCVYEDAHEPGEARLA